MIPINNFNVSAAQVAVNPVIILKVDGMYISATTLAYLQIHDSIGVPANGAVPLKQEPISGNNSPFYFEFKRGELNCNLGCYVAISTTDGTFTASTDKMDVSVELSSPERPLTLTTVGDLTTAVTGLQVWSEASVASSRSLLYALEVDGTNLTGAVQQYIMIFPLNLASVTAGTACNPESCFPIAPGGTNLVVKAATVLSVRTLANGLQFGDEGFDPSGTPAGDGVYHYGCSIVISSTAKVFTACNGTVAIRAQYK